MLRFEILLVQNGQRLYHYSYITNSFRTRGEDTGSPYNTWSDAIICDWVLYKPESITDNA